MVSAHLPKLAEQKEFYKNVLDAAKGRKVVFRTLDIGGDKVLPYMRVREEENPAMGWRAIRIGLDRPGLLRYQLRALLAAAADTDLYVMFPLVSTVDEFRKAKEILFLENARMERLDGKRTKGLKIGTMLEVPALIWQLDELLPDVDFLSVGTNDLLQFLYASDRGNARVGERYAFLSRPVLKILAEINKKCKEYKVPVSLCGEVVGNPLAAMAVIGLGYDEVSIPTSSIGPVKRMVRSVNRPRLQEAVQKLMLEQGGDIEVRLREIADRQGIKL